jgi:hypothetical protein
MNKGYIVIKHQLFREISDQEVLDILETKVGKENIHFVDIKYKIIDMEEIGDLPNLEAKAYQRQKYDNELRPLIEKYPENKIAYFGSVSIPLALHLGYCVGAWKSVEIYNIDRDTNTWVVDDSDLSEIPQRYKFPKDTIEISTDVLYKVEASYAVQDQEVKESIGSTYQTIALSLQNFDKNAFKGLEHVVKFGAKFSEGLDALANYIPLTEKIHLIVTTPVGVAFYLGTRINPNVTKPIVTYQYRTNQSIPYEEVFVLQEEGTSLKPIGDEDQKYISEIRAKLRKELEEKISVFAKEKVEQENSNDTQWIDLIMPAGGNYTNLKIGYWKNLANISKTPLVSAILSDITTEADKREGFYLEDNGAWQITDRFIFNVAQRLGKDEGKVLRALRMFILHEGFHVTQQLTNHTAPSIGRFPRVLEEADYVADVWAFFHEYALSKRYYPKEAENIKDFFKDIFLLATETMWSFVELSNDYNEMQVRGLNRFLIWYWAFNLVDDPKCKTINDIVDRLSQKPILEFKGLQIRAINQRVIYRLNSFKANELEIGYFDPSTTVKRYGNAGGIDLVSLVDGFKKRNGSTIMEQMKALYHNIGPSLRF